MSLVFNSANPVLVPSMVTDIMIKKYINYIIIHIQIKRIDNDYFEVDN
jgi:hypothetical protein